MVTSGGSDNLLLRWNRQVKWFSADPRREPPLRSQLAGLWNRAILFRSE
jgi:hypothetical protein